MIRLYPFKCIKVCSNIFNYLRKFIECNIYRNNNAELDFQLVSLFLAMDQSHDSMRLILTSFVKYLYILFLFQFVILQKLIYRLSYISAKILSDNIRNNSEHLRSQNKITNDIIKMQTECAFEVCKMIQNNQPPRVKRLTNKYIKCHL